MYYKKVQILQQQTLLNYFKIRIRHKKALGPIFLCRDRPRSVNKKLLMCL